MLLEMLIFQKNDRDGGGVGESKKLIVLTSLANSPPPPSPRKAEMTLPDLIQFVVD